MNGYVYLAHPIDQATESTVGGKIGVVGRWLQKQGIGTYDSSLAWVVGAGQKPHRHVAAVNMAALRRADAVVAFLPPGVPTIGTPIELDRAISLGIPTLILGGEDSWALADYAGRGYVMIAQPGVDIEHYLNWLVANRGQASTELEPLPYSYLRAVDGVSELNGTLGEGKYAGDAGFDLTVSRKTKIGANGMTDVPCNLAVELPDWAWGLIIGRSSTLRTKRIQVHLGVIDSGYRGELFAAVSRLPVVESGIVAPYEGDRWTVQPGERLAQLILIPKGPKVNPTLVGALTPSDRGTNGFGSTGV